jgi:MoxR-like ATPase
MSAKHEHHRPPVAVPVGPTALEILKIACRARKPVLLEGETGIGKSDLCVELARELGIGLVVLDLTLLEPTDLIGLPREREGKTTYAPPQILPAKGTQGVLVLEEWNRAETPMRQSSMQLLTTRRLHEYVLPDGWSLIATINPEDGDYQVTSLDPAMRSRFLQVRLKADYRSWLDWAAEQGLDPAVLKLARDDARVLESVPPRTWKYVSDVLLETTPADRARADVMQGLLAGYLPTPWVEALLATIDECRTLEDFDISRLLFDFDRDTKQRSTLERLLSEGATGAVERTVYAVLEKIEGPSLAASIECGQIRLEAFDAFVAAIPGDYRERLTQALAKNPAAARLLDVRPAQLIAGNYRGSNAWKKVEQWRASQALRYRVTLLSAALARYIEKEADLIVLRHSNPGLASLGHFVAQLRQAVPENGLEGIFRKLQVEPIAPRIQGARP